MSQDELYQWIADQDCGPVDESPLSPADQFLADVVKRLKRRGQWTQVKALLEGEDA